MFTQRPPCPRVPSAMAPSFGATFVCKLYRDFDEELLDRVSKTSAQPETLDEPRLHDMRQNDIAWKNKTERDPVGRGQRDEA
jgi:hypothetical protein